METMSLEDVKVVLQSFEDDPTMNTAGRYSPTAHEWPDSIMPFREVHLAYLRKNKTVNPAHYLSNLKLMIKIR